MTYDAQLYRLVHRGNEGDVAFYGRACEGARAVLELGCGWGRVLRHIATAGRVVLGIDLDRHFLSEARARLPPEVHLLRADMARFALRVPLDRVIAPYGALYNLDRQALTACLGCVRRTLAADGRFLFDVWNADAFHEESEPDDLADDALVPVVSVEHGGRAWDVFERSRWDRAARRVDSTYLYVARDGSETVQGRIAHHYLLSSELESLLADAGLELVDVRGDFEGGPFHHDADHLIVTARRR